MFLIDVQFTKKIFKLDLKCRSEDASVQILSFFFFEFMTQKRRRAETLDQDHALYRNVDENEQYFLYPPRDPDPVQIWCVLFLPMLHTLTKCLENGTSSFSVNNRQTTKTNVPKTRLPGDFRTNKTETDHYPVVCSLSVKSVFQL